MLATRLPQCHRSPGCNVAIAARYLAHPILLPQVMQIAVAVLKGTNKPALYRSCTKDELLQLVRSDDRRLYVMLHNIDGPGALSLQTAAVKLAAGCDGQARCCTVSQGMDRCSCCWLCNWDRVHCLLCSVLCTWLKPLRSW